MLTGQGLMIRTEKVEVSDPELSGMIEAEKADKQKFLNQNKQNKKWPF